RSCALIAILLVVSAGASHAATEGDRVSLGNGFVLRELTFDGHVWRTTRFARGDGSDALDVKSDEFQLRFLDDSEVSLDGYEAAGEPKRESVDGEERLSIHYAPRTSAALPANAPGEITIVYSQGHEAWIQKTVTLRMKE